MTRITAGIGGGSPNNPAAGRQATQDWRHPQQTGREEMDWADPRFATPQPAPKRRFGKYVEPVLPDVPQLPERNIRVRARPPATYYTMDGVPIPAEWTTLPISPGLLAAISAGDLERGEDPDDSRPEPLQRGQPARRRHTTQVTPPSAGE